MKFWKQIKFLRNLAPKHETRKKNPAQRKTISITEIDKLKFFC